MTFEQWLEKFPYQFNWEEEAILNALWTHGELKGTDLARKLQFQVKHSLAELLKIKLITRVPVGNRYLYRLASQKPKPKESEDGSERQKPTAKKSNIEDILNVISVVDAKKLYHALRNLFSSDYL